MPVLGFMTDKFGNIIWFIIACGALRVIADLIQISLPECEDACWQSVIPYVIYGISYAIFMGVNFTCVSYLVEPKKQSLAFGLITCFLNTGISIFPPFVGYIHDQTIDVGYGYFWIYMLFIFLSIISLCLKIGIKVWDQKKRFGILQGKDPNSRF